MTGMLGKKHSEETKRRIAEKKKAQGIVPKSAFKKGVKPWNTGKKCPHLSERNRLMNTQRAREEHWNWKGGISKVDRIVRRMPEYLTWRSSIFERDNWTCQTCHARGYVTVHHIKAFVLVLRENKIQSTQSARECEELWDTTNGVTLCEPCHSLTDNYKHKARVK
jgi:5-methylcytosine-specific restriction endonuclease McrA